MCYKHTLTTTQVQTGPALEQPEASAQRLAQLQTFSRAVGDAAAGLDVKPFLIPYLPAQLLGIVIGQASQPAEEGNGDDGLTGSSSVQTAAASLANLHLAAVEELCIHAISSNVHELAELILQLPAPTALSSSGTDSGGEISLVVSTSTAYTAAACNVLLELPNLEPDGQTEACQEVSDYLEQLTADHLTGLLLWGMLQQPHPLLPSGPQLPAQLPEDLRLSLLQAGLEMLHQQADSDAGVVVDSRLEAAASVLAVLCSIQQACELTEEQWDMVEQALEEGSSSQGAVDQCVEQLLADGLPVQDLLTVTSSLQSRIETATAEPQAAAVATAVVQKMLSQALPMLSGGSLQQQAQLNLSNGDTGAQENGTVHEDEPDSSAEVLQLTTADKASDCILGILESLQSPGVSEQAKALVIELRQYVWTSLQHHLLTDDPAKVLSTSLQPAQLQLLEVVLGLSTPLQSTDAALSTTLVSSTSISPQKTQGPAPIHWEGWAPEQGSEDLAHGQQLLLVSHTRAVVEKLWPNVDVGSHHVDCLSAAQQLFMMLLDKGHEADELHGLHHLLADVWRNGQALPADQVHCCVPHAACCHDF